MPLALGDIGEAKHAAAVGGDLQIVAKQTPCERPGGRPQGSAGSERLSLDEIEIEIAVVVVVEQRRHPAA